MKETIMNGLLIFATKLQSQKHFSAIKNGLTSLLPIIIIGSFCTLFSNMVCSTSPGYLSLANLPGMSWLSYFNPVFTAANYGTMNFIAIGATILIAMELGESYGIRDKALPAVALGSYISLCLTSVSKTLDDGQVITIANALSSDFTSAKGLFVGMIAALVSTEIYCRLANSGKLSISMPESVPSNVSRSFEVLFPACLTIFAVSLFGLVFQTVTGMTVPTAITRFIQAPLSNVLTGLPGYLLIMFCTAVLWVFGIHGTQALKAIYEPVLLASFAENEAAYAAGLAIPNIINKPFQSCFSTVTGAGITGGLLIAIVLFSRRKDYKTIAKLAIPCGIFNINEPLVFGLPIVMNPILALPFMAAPAVSAAFAYFMTSIGFCGRMVVNVPWTTPAGLAAFLASGGNLGAGITQILCVLLAAVIYTPFVLLANRQEEMGEIE